MQSNFLDFFFCEKTHNSNIAMPGQFGHEFLWHSLYESWFMRLVCPGSLELHGFVFDLLAKLGFFYDAIHSVAMGIEKKFKNKLRFKFFWGLVVGCCSRLHPCGVHKNEAFVWSLCVGEFGTLQGRKDW
jgi:hypothetical protein